MSDDVITNQSDLCDIVVQMIEPLKCSYSIATLRDFIQSESDTQREYRLSGKFGFGFKFRKGAQPNQFFFDQYEEDETQESLKWIEDKNKILSGMRS